MNVVPDRKHLHSVGLACLSRPSIPRTWAFYSWIADGRKGQEQQTSKLLAAGLKPRSVNAVVEGKMRCAIASLFFQHGMCQAGQSYCFRASKAVS